MTSQTSTATQAKPAPARKYSLVVGEQVCGLSVARYGKRIRSEQFEERIVAFLFPVIESEQPLLEFRMSGLRHHRGAAARETPQRKRKRETSQRTR